MEWIVSTVDNHTLSISYTYLIVSSCYGLTADSDISARLLQKCPCLTVYYRSLFDQSFSSNTHGVEIKDKKGFLYRSIVGITCRSTLPDIPLRYVFMSCILQTLVMESISLYTFALEF